MLSEVLEMGTGWGGVGAGAGRREGILWLAIPGRVEEGHRRFWWRGEPLEPFLCLLQGPRVRPRAEKEAVKTGSLHGMRVPE